MSNQEEARTEAQATFYPELSEDGVKQAEAVLEAFRSKIKSAVQNAVSDVADELYFHYADHIQTDAWTNFRTSIERSALDYGNIRQTGFGREVRRKMLDEHRAEIIDDLNADLLDQIKSLEELVESLRSANRLGL